MTEIPKRPPAVWIAIILQCIVGIFVLAIDALAIYAVVTTNPRGYLSTTDTVFSVAIALISVMCFISVFLAIKRRKVSRYLPFASAVIVLLFAVHTFVTEASQKGSIGSGFLTGWIIALSFVLFWILLPSILLSLGKAVNAYFGNPTDDKDSHLLEPPPPPKTF